MKTRSLMLAVVFSFFTALPASALDWPQWRGPNRDGVSKETGLLKEWPKAGPPLAWTFDKAGLGFSGPAVVGDRLYTMGSREKAGKWTTYLIALDISGKAPKEDWACLVGDMYRHDMNYWGNGPRSTPTVDGDFVYALGGFGDLVCVAVKDGTLKWKKNLNKDLDGEMMSLWGNSESVLIDGDNLICAPGGEKGTVAALNKKTGEVIWRSTKLKDKATYASIMPMKAGGVKQYVAMTYIDNIEGSAIAGVDAKTGDLLWYKKMFSGHSFAVCPTPLIKGSEVFATCGYSGGAKLFQISAKGAKVAAVEEYKQKVIKNAHGGVVLVGDHVYGFSEKVGWVCQNWKTGDAEWKEKNKMDCVSACLTAADGHLYLFSDEGECVLLQTDPQKWNEKGRFTIPRNFKNPPALQNDMQAAKVWTHPVIANGKLYLREQDFLYCYDVRDKK